MLQYRVYHPLLFCDLHMILQQILLPTPARRAPCVEKQLTEALDSAHGIQHDSSVDPCYPILRICAYICFAVILRIGIFQLSGKIPSVYNSIYKHNLGISLEYLATRKLESYSKTWSETYPVWGPHRLANITPTSMDLSYF